MYQHIFFVSSVNFLERCHRTINHTTLHYWPAANIQPPWKVNTFRWSKGLPSSICHNGLSSCTEDFKQVEWLMGDSEDQHKCCKTVILCRPELQLCSSEDSVTELFLTNESILKIYYAPLVLNLSPSNNFTAHSVTLTFIGCFKNPAEGRNSVVLIALEVSHMDSIGACVKSTLPEK